MRKLLQGTVGERPRMRPKTAEITNRMIATKKMIFAISTAKPAIPPKPSTAAISAMIELIAESDIVDEAGDVGVRLATFDPADDELRQGGKLVEVDLLRELPAAARHLLLDHDVLGGDVDWGRIVPMNDNAVGALDGLDLDFRPFDRAQMHPALDPAFEKNVIDGIGRAHDDVGTLDRLLRQADGNDFDAEHRCHGGGEGFAALRIGAEAMDGRDVAHRAGRHELRTRLPAGAENADALRILAGEVLDA